MCAVSPGSPATKASRSGGVKRAIVQSASISIGARLDERLSSRLHCSAAVASFARCSATVLARQAQAARPALTSSSRANTLATPSRRTFDQ